MEFQSLFYIANLECVGTYKQIGSKCLFVDPTIQVNFDEAKYVIFKVSSVVI